VSQEFGILGNVQHGGAVGGVRSGVMEHMEYLAGTPG
jgi:hypothetical protein